MKTENKYLQQFHELKEKHPEVLLLFRRGDFYECYEGDASIASLILGITLTKRKDGGNMTGFPHHALDTYLPKLIRAGKRVAICDQIDAPKQKTQTTTYKTDDGQFDVIENVKPNKKETEMENKEKEQQVTTQQLNEVRREAEQTVYGIATETIKALKGELPSTLADYLYKAIGKLEVIKIKHALCFVPNRTEISFLINQAEVTNGK